MVPDPDSSFAVSASSPPSVDGHPDTGVGLYNPPQPLITTPQGLAPRWLLGLEQEYPPAVQTVLVNSRKPTTRKTSVQKWKRFWIWCSRCSMSPAKSSLDCLLNLKLLGLSLSLVRVHLAALTAFHKSVEGFLIFTHPTTATLLRASLICFLQCRRLLHSGTSI